MFYLYQLSDGVLVSSTEKKPAQEYLAAKGLGIVAAPEVVPGAPAIWDPEHRAFVPDTSPGVPLLTIETLAGDPLVPTRRFRTGGRCVFRLVDVAGVIDDRVVSVSLDRIANDGLVLAPEVLLVDLPVVNAAGSKAVVLPSSGRFRVSPRSDGCDFAECIFSVSL